MAADARIRLTVSDALSGIDVNSIAFYVNDTEVEFTRQGDPFSLTLTYENVDGFTPGTEVAVRVAACDLASTPNCGELTDYTFTVAMGGQASTAAKEGEVIPNGYWANDPARRKKPARAILALCPNGTCRTSMPGPTARC